MGAGGVRRHRAATAPAQRYVNFLADEGEAGVRSAYEPETLVRLQGLKSRYDPTNFFSPEPEHQAGLADAMSIARFAAA